MDTELLIGELSKDKYETATAGDWEGGSYAIVKHWQQVHFLLKDIILQWQNP